MTSEKLEELTHSFKASKVLIIGDVMIDKYLKGKVNRISPEAPVQILDHTKTIVRLGGAANVALNIKALNATPILLSIIGEDSAGEEFLDRLSQQDITSEYIVRHPIKRTTLKTRIMSGHQHLLRVDFEDKSPIDNNFSDQIIEIYEQIIEEQKPEVIILQDYNKGLLTPYLIEAIIKKANQENIPTAVDPKFENFFQYKNVTLFKPNLKELNEGLNITTKPHLSSLNTADALLKAKLNNKISFITLSEHGIFANDGDKILLHPTPPRIISDVCGAGDAVISITALCLAKNTDLESMITLANIAGGQVCEVAGVCPLNLPKIKSEMLKNQ